nr:MAG TPA: hypothetical protein [Caudoviricetes sp.]
MRFSIEVSTNRIYVLRLQTQKVKTSLRVFTLILFYFNWLIPLK